MMASRLSAMGSACISMRGSDRVIKKELHLLRSANADRLLQALLLVEVLKEVQLSAPGRARTSQ